MNEGFKLTQAIQELVPEGTNWTVRGPNIETDVWIEDENLRPTKTAIQAKMAEIQTDYDAKQYQRDRKQEYPTIEELVVALYDEEDKASIIEKRNAVKAKYPKPE